MGLDTTSQAWEEAGLASSIVSVHAVNQAAIITAYSVSHDPLC